MINLYVIGTVVVIIGFGITGFWFAAKSAGKKEERNKKKDLHINETIKINKRRVERGSDSIHTVRERLRKNARD